MAAMMAIVPYVAAGLQIGGTIMSAVGAHNAGEAQKAAATREAAALHINAENAAGAAENQAQQEDLKTQYVLSAARAAAAGQSGSATDPSSVNVMRTIAGEGKLRSLNTLYSGLSQEQELNTQAAMTRYSGNQAARAGNIAAFGDIGQGAGSLYANYKSPSIDNSGQPVFGGTSLASKYGSVPDYTNTDTTIWPNRAQFMAMG